MRCNYPQGIAPVTSTVFHAASQSGRTCSRISRFSLVFPRVGESTVKALAPCPVCLLPESDAASMLSPLAVSTRSGWNSMRLFLCEKPSQGKDIGKVLGATQRDNGCLKGPGVIVTWCIGHLVEAAPPEAYDAQLKHWSIEHLPIIPERWRVEVKPKTATQFKVVKQLLEQAIELVIATDANSEGEMIAREIRSEERTYELQSLMRRSLSVFCLK